MRSLRAGGAIALLAFALPASASATVTTLQPAGITATEGFGHSVAISGSTVAVGDPGAAPDGAVYVFTQTGGSWSNPPAVAEISNPQPAQGLQIATQFGSSVALAGNQLFVADNGVPSTARFVFEFDKPAGGWADTSDSDGVLGAPDAMTDPNSTHRHYGSSIAASGDALIVGDPGCPLCGGVNQDQPVSGEAFVYKAAADGWGDVDMPVKTLTQPSGQADDSEFGSAVGIAGSAVAVGSPTAEATGDGAVFAFGQSGTDFAQASLEAVLTATIDDDTEGADFGGVLAMSPGDIAVGAPSWTFQQELNGEMVMFTSAGGVWAFDAGAGGRFSNTSAIALEAGDSIGESLGTSVGISGQLLVDGGPNPTDNMGHPEPGVAGGLFESPLGWNGAEVSSPNEPFGYCCGADVNYDAFGQSVAIAGSTEVVGMPSTSVAGIPGAAYVSTGVAPTITIKEPGNGATTAASNAAVSGTIDFPGSLTGVAVNGVAATVTGDDYTATVPLASGKNTLTATVTTGDGQTASASIVVTSTAAPPPPPKQGSPSIPSQVQQVAANGASSIEISCSGPGACSGSIVESVGVLNGKAVSARVSKRPKRVVIGRAGFRKLAAGKRASVKLKLNTTGRRLLAKAHGRLKATITIVYTSGTHKHSKTAKLKLRSAKRGGHK